LAKLDRVMIYVEWESNYPFAKVVMLPKGVSDHNPLRVSFGDKGQANQPFFCFFLLRLIKEEGRK
jgi:hypothetical protein